MAMKVELKGAKIVETPTDTNVSTAANSLDNIAATLDNVIEVDNNRIVLNPSATDVPLALGNITTSEIVVLIPNRPITVKLNGSTTPITVRSAFILFGTNITDIVVTNPSATEQVVIRKYLASSVG